MLEKRQPRGKTIRCWSRNGEPLDPGAELHMELLKLEHVYWRNELTACDDCGTAIPNRDLRLTPYGLVCEDCRETVKKTRINLGRFLRKWEPSGEAC